MGLLHLIVHRSMIEEELASGLTPPEKKPRLQAVLERIREVEFRESLVQHIVYDNDDPDIPEGIHHVVEMCQGFSSVILYGISISVCLPFCERRLQEAGLSVRYDVAGTIE